MDENLLILALNLKRGFGPRIITSLIQKYGNVKDAIRSENIELDEELKKAEEKAKKEPKGKTKSLAKASSAKKK